MALDDNSSDGESSDEENPEAMSDKKAWLAWARALTWDAAVADDRDCFSVDALPDEKCAAAALVGVDDIGELPSLQKRAKRTPVHQRALDVAARWAASRAGTADDEAATEYATALAAIARRQLSKNSSGGDGVAKPLRKKQHC